MERKGDPHKKGEGQEEVGESERVYQYVCNVNLLPRCVGGGDAVEGKVEIKAVPQLQVLFCKKVIPLVH